MHQLNINSNHSNIKYKPSPNEKKSFPDFSCLLMFLFSCKKDDASSPYDAAYTDESPEVSKANVEQNAIDLVDQLDAMTSLLLLRFL